MDFINDPDESNDFVEKAYKQTNKGNEEEEYDDEIEDEDEDDENDEDEDEDEEHLIVLEINRLQDELSFNPYDYDKHVLLISKLRTIGELEILRASLERMNKFYPLSPKQWKEWIQDEQRISEHPNNIFKLYERAVSEYFDIQLWIDYIEFAITFKETIGIDELRKIFDKSLVLAGLHVTRGSEIWKKYITFESSLLNEQNLDVRQQIRNIYSLYCSQLTIPLKDMEQTYAEFQKWKESIKIQYNIDLEEEDSKNFAKTKSKYNNALNKLKTIIIYETKLEESEPPHYEEYMEYLKIEKGYNDLASLQCLFERAITDNCLQSNLWLDYLKHSDCKLVVSDILLPIYEKAVRNCYWDHNIWLRYIEAVERVVIVNESKDYSELKDRIESILTRALKNVTYEEHKNLWITYLHFVRRQTNKLGWNNETEVEKLRQCFRQIIDQLEQYQNADYCYDLYKYFANVEAKYCKNLSNSRNIWNEFLQKSANLRFQANIWLDYGNFELLYGDKEHYQEVLLKGLDTCTDYPETIGTTLLKFEKENGDDIHLYDALINKYDKIMKKIINRREKEEAKILKTNTMKRKQEEPSNSMVNKKKKTETNNESDSNINHGQTIKTNEAKRNETIFISNLDFKVTEDDLKDIFSKFGTVNDIRLVRNYKGFSKGFGYVEFANVESVKKALTNDRMLIQQRPVFISEMDKRKDFEYGKTKEENKLFIKNIPPEITKDMLLDKVFAEYKDSIVNARLVTFRNGYSKGIAYVDMKDSKTAAKAVSEKNDFELNGRKLLVTISDPSKSNNQKQNTENKVLFSKTSESKINSMIPYSVRRSNPTKVRLQIDNKMNQTSTQEISERNLNENLKLNNDQFRSMFLKFDSKK